MSVAMTDLDQPAPPPGWAATLELAYGRAGARTLPTHRAHSGPLRVQKHFEPEPGLCEHILVHPPGGIAGGDRLSITVDVGSDAHVRLTTPGATRWYRGDSPATQDITATVGAGATLELLPHPHLVFDGAQATNHLSLSLAADATFLGWDLVGLGRPAGDHPFATGRWSSRLELTRAGRLVYADHLDLPADSPLRASSLGLAGHLAFGTALLVGPRASPELVEALRNAPTGLVSGVTQTADGVITARALSPSAEAIHQWFTGLWAVSHPLLTGRTAPAHPPRIWRT
jgi:urease accessory protein